VQCAGGEEKKVVKMIIANWLSQHRIKTTDFTMCPRCGHGGHLEHLKLWFAVENTCPSGCGCSCMDKAYDTQVVPEEDWERMDGTGMREESHYWY